MRRWGIVVSVFYAVFVLFLLVPAAMTTFPKRYYWKGVGSGPAVLEKLLDPLKWWYSEANWWLWVGLLIGGQILLLFLSVDASRRMLRPRQHVAVTMGITAALVALLTFAAVVSLDAVAYGDGDETSVWRPTNYMGPQLWKVLLWLTALWVAWGAVFYLYYRGTSEALSSAVSWLIKGSVLELLIAVPAHVWVQRRGDCSAPWVTGFGIATGIAVMLLSFGPGVLALYKKRIDMYSKRRAPSG